MRNNTAFRFLLDQLSNGHLKWSNVCDDFDTVVLVDDDGDCKRGLQNVEDALASQTKLKSRWVSHSLFTYFPLYLNYYACYFFASTAHCWRGVDSLHEHP
jgi:hypothetical protein